MNCKIRAFASVSFISVLSACGGGTTTGGGTAPDPILAAFSSSFVSSWAAYTTSAANLLVNVRYQNQVGTGNYYSDMNGSGSFDAGDIRLYGNPIESTGIHFAHAAGLTGNGQIVAVTDDGFRTTHEAVSGSVHTSHTSIVDSHGTFVASVITGDSSSMIGVAPQAQLIIGDYYSNANIAAVGASALANQAVAWNNSWGYNNAYANTTDFNTYFGSGSGAAAFQAYKDYAAYGNVVFALSNNPNETEADLVAGLPILDPALEAGWIAVANAIPTFSGDDVTDVDRVSSACLNAAAWCITADGTWSHGAYGGSNSQYGFGTGTSFAAPVVSGALALLAEAFPSLTPHQLRLRLFATADNTFTGFTTDQVVELAPGYDSAVSNEFGHGFLDVAQALLPIGQISINSANGQTYRADQALVKSGAASGGAIAKALSDVSLRAVDSFSGAFDIQGSDLVETAQPLSIFTEQNAALLGKPADHRAISTALFDRDPTVQNYIGDLHVATYLPHYSDQISTAGLSIGQRFETGAGYFDWQAGIGSDNGALLPVWQNEDGQQLASFGMSWATELSEQSKLQVSAVMASSAASGTTSAVMMNSGEISYTTAQVFDRNDSLKLSLRQPFAVTSGVTDLTIATNSIGGGLETISVDLSPEHREMQIALDYKIALEENSDLMLSLVHAMNRGHVAGAEETGVFFGYRMNF